MDLRDIEEVADGRPDTTPSTCHSPPGCVGVLIRSKLLDGEIIVLALKKKALKRIKQNYPDLVIYFPPEVEELSKDMNNEDSIKQVHMVKKTMRGWIVPSKGERRKPRCRR